MKVLVTGGKGQLAQCIASIANNYSNLEFVYVDYDELDITNERQVTEYFSQHNFNYCVNCAAYTAVDKAEEEKTLAYNVNVLGAKHLANACLKHEIVLIHISTDFVFDGKSNTPYTEDSKTNPISVYGQTKYEGEQQISSILKQYYIIRTSWLYSEYGNNFVKTMLKLSESKKELAVVSDQIGTPTYAKDLAEIIMLFITLKNSTFGLYNFSNQGVASWYDFAKTIFDLKNASIKTKPIPTINYPTPAKRPNYSVLSKDKITNNLPVAIPYWRDSLKICLQYL